MEEMTKRENPQVREWTRELAETERRVKALEARRAKVVELVDQERDKAEEAIRNQREYQDKKTRHDELRRQLSDILGQREAMIAKQQASKTFDVVFEVHTDSAKPSRHYEPKESLVILMALLVGIAAAVGMVFFLEFTDHSIKTTEDVKRHLNLPVLGTIPEFSFAEIEGFERYSRYGGLFGGRGRREVYPISMDKHSPEPLAQRPKVRTGNSARRQIIAMIIAGVVLAGILALMGLFGNISLPFGFWGGADGSDAIGNSASGESGSK
jgi:hypothetical protein